MAGLRLLLVMLALGLAGLLPAAVAAQGGSALAQLVADGSSLVAQGRDRGRARPLLLTLKLSQPVPYRVFLLDGPPRLVVDFREVDFTGTDAAALDGAGLVPAIRWGRFRPGWSRMVVELPGPYVLDSATQHTRNSGDPDIQIALSPVAPDAFRPAPNAMSALWDLPQPAVPLAKPKAALPRKLRVALDPGHGGIDPGAQAGGVKEADLVLSFARELTESLTRAGVEVVLTRDDDSFVPLERRMTAARGAGADLLISLHADALPAGEAAGATIYSWDSQANDRAARQLAMLHDRDDLLAGVDLAETDDEVANVLMDLARRDTHPRSVNFAKFVASEFARADVRMHKRPVKGAGFSVLKSPDIPSVLVELGFLTDAQDRANLTDPAGRARMVAALTRAVTGWAQDDAARAALLRQ
ncbi:N-acetylmuramoyl-L-alanine amidase [Paracoccus jiaweipingae]|uniref:N-acetylmuramoyl-L-alanine amidase n=1 Tax=unclassified Paracoccus (in: a-proteobacteria) TaxID=2688777 RepID=UPI00378D5373